MSFIEGKEAERVPGQRIDTGVRSFHEASRGRSIPVPESFQEQPWNVLMAKKSRMKGGGGWRLLLTLGAFLAVSAGTLILDSPLHIASSWLAALAIMLATDGFGFFERFLALQSRWILAVMSGSLAGTMEHPAQNTILLCLIVWGLGFWLVRTLNTKWLAAECMQATTIGQSVVSAVRNGLDNDPVTQWEHQRSAVRWILSEMGAGCTEEGLDVVHKPVWLAGYLYAWEKTEALRRKADRADGLRASLEDSRKRILRLEESLRGVNAELAAYKRDARASMGADAAASSQIMQLRLQLDDKDRRIRDLIQTNEELMQGIAEDNRPKPEREKALLVHRLMQTGMSQNDAGRAAGLSKTSASRLMQKARKEKWIE